MLKIIAPAVIASALLVAPAHAETDWGTYKSFANTRCEDDKTIADIKESLKGLKFNDGGGATFGSASKVRIVKSQTVQAATNKLVCQLSMRTMEAGQTYSYRSRFTVTTKSDGSWRTLYQPNF
jgi:hypothetical protein